MVWEKIDIVCLIELVLLVFIWIVVAKYGSVLLYAEIVLTSSSRDNQEPQINSIDEDGPPAAPPVFEKERSDKRSFALFVIAILILLLVLFGIFYTWLLRKLQAGIRERNAGKIRTWFNIRLVLLVIEILFMGSTVGIVTVFGIAYRVWALYVAHEFLKKLIEEGVEGEPTVLFGAASSTWEAQRQP